jgi:hypothetical protein
VHCASTHHNHHGLTDACVLACRTRDLCSASMCAGSQGGAAAAEGALREAAAILRMPAQQLSPNDLLQLGSRLTVGPLEACALEALLHGEDHTSWHAVQVPHSHPQ